MGAFLVAHAIPPILAEANRRFEPGYPLAEMVALHKEFGLFSGRHRLASVARLLGITPRDDDERRGWLGFLDYLGGLGSDVAGMSAHDRLIQLVRENLESETPLPVVFAFHLAGEADSLGVTTGPAVSLSSQVYLQISAPVQGD